MAMSLDEMDRMNEIEDKIELINSNVEQLLGAIRGNPLTMDGGIVKDIQNLADRVAENHQTLTKRMELLESRVTPIERFMERVNWTIVIICFICTFLGAVIGLLLQYIK